MYNTFDRKSNDLPPTPEDRELEQIVVHALREDSQYLADRLKQTRQLVVPHPPPEPPNPPPTSSSHSPTPPPTSCCSLCPSPATYRCPRCSTPTCSLPCVRAHKRKHNCSGTPTPEAFTPLPAYSSLHLKRDYHFLETLRNGLESLRRANPSVARFNHRVLPPPLHALSKASRAHGVVLQIMSEGMGKRAGNTSRYERRHDTITWRVGFVLHGGGGGVGVGERVERVVLSPFERGEGGKRGTPTTTTTTTTEDEKETGRHGGSSVAVIHTDWASERFKLGEIFKTAWRRNPGLTSHPIRRGYNRAGRWIPSGMGKAGEEVSNSMQEERDEGVHSHKEPVEEVAAKEGDNKRQRSEGKSTAGEISQQGLHHEENIPEEEHGGTPDKERSVHSDTSNEESEDSDTEGLTKQSCSTEQEKDSSPKRPTNSEKTMGVPSTSVETSTFSGATSDDETNAQRRLLQHFEAVTGGEYIFLYRAERLGNTVAYYPLNSSDTLHDNLRSVFYVVESPVIEVVPLFMADQFPLITTEQKTFVRESFRKNSAAAWSKRVDGDSSTTTGSNAKGPHESQKTTPFPDRKRPAEQPKSDVPCGNFRKGTCRYGDQCPRTHYSEEELPVCRFLMKGLKCAHGERCLYSHDPRRAPASQYYHVSRGQNRRGGYDQRGFSSPVGNGSGRASFSTSYSAHEPSPRGPYQGNRGRGGGGMRPSGHFNNMRNEPRGNWGETTNHVSSTPSTRMYPADSFFPHPSNLQSSSPVHPYPAPVPVDGSSGAPHYGFSQASYANSQNVPTEPRMQHPGLSSHHQRHGAPDSFPPPHFMH